MPAGTRFVSTVLILVIATWIAPTFAQDRPMSPRGRAATQIGDHWIEVDYGRPILRGRGKIFESGDAYGQKVLSGAPLWRVGANATTRLTSEVDLRINGTQVPAGEYSLFIDLAEGGWTAVISRQPHMESFDREKVAQGITWGAYGYSPEFDVVRAPMRVETIDLIVDQMTIYFADVDGGGGKLAVAWADHLALLPFEIAPSS